MCIRDSNGTLLLVSHDRDFLDRIVTSTVAYEGEGQWIEYAGGYNDMLAQRGADLAKSDKTTPAPKLTKEAERQAPRPSRRKLSYHQQRALETLPGKMEGLQSSITEMETALADPELYAKDPKRFEIVTQSLSSAQADLATAEEEWLELELLREEMEGA